MLSIKKLIEKLDAGKEKLGSDISLREYAWHVDSYEGVWSPYTKEEQQVFDAWDAAVEELVEIGEPAAEPLSRVFRDRRSSYWKKRNARQALERIEAKRDEEIRKRALGKGFYQTP
jgi:hypothetical protein